MNGYRDRVRRHQRELAESAARGEQDAVPQVDWMTVTIEGVTYALDEAMPHPRGDAGDLRRR